MKKVNTIYTTLLLTICLMQSCSLLNRNATPTHEKIGTTYVCADKYGNSKIILHSTGDFVYSESSDGMIVEICQCIKGRWYQKKDTVYLTTLYQGDYFTELDNSVSDDSVLICFYSTQTGKPTDKFAYVNEENGLVFPTTNGHLYISCTEKESLAQQLLMGIDADDEIRRKGISIECGRAYKCYIKDCHPIVMRERKYILSDSCLLDISVKRLYHIEDLP